MKFWENSRLLKVKKTKAKILEFFWIFEFFFVIFGFWTLKLAHRQSQLKFFNTKFTSLDQAPNRLFLYHVAWMAIKEYFKNFKLKLFSLKLLAESLKSNNNKLKAWL